MEKDSVLWFLSNQILRKLISVIIFAFLIIVVSASDALAVPDESGRTAIASKAGMQQVTVSGKITDASTGEALAGVNIVVEGTAIGAISDIDGKYSLPGVDRNATLAFSFIGYVKQVVAISGRTVINVALVPELTGLEEVVVIGYGTQKKETLTGSVSAIKSSEIMSTKSISLAAAIQGKIPGVQIRQQTGLPGTFNSRISVRGFGTPLLVIDGVVRDQMDDFERLNPEDIESVSVLKDAAASIYGLDAANGVFIVTTKKGFAGKTEFSLNTMYSVKSPTNDFSLLNVDAYTMRYMWNEMARNSESSSNVTNADELAKWKAGTEPYYTDYNWWDNLVRDNVSSSELTFNVRGGNDLITFFSSFGYNNDGGFFKNNELLQYDRYTFRTNVDAKLAKGLKMGVKFYGRYENTLSPTRGTDWTFKRILTNDRGIGPYTLDGLNNYTQVPSENTNVFAELSREASGYVQSLKLQYQTTIDLNYDVSFIKGLSIGALIAYDGQNNDAKNLYKNFMLYDYVTGAAKASSVAPTTLTNTIDNYTRKELQANMTFRRTFGSHNVGGTLVFQARKIDNSSLQGKRQYDDLYTKDILSQASTTNQSTTGSRSEEAYLSYIGRFNYDYKAKYLLEFSFREDGSYRYAPSQRWGFFPAVSAAWRIGQEPFLRNALPMVTDLKLRASWGQSGLNAGDPFQYYEGYTWGSVAQGYVFGSNVLTKGMIPPGIVNSNLSWISTTTTDLGLDLEMWKGKLGLIFDVFRRTRNGDLSTRVTTLPNTFGANFPQENLNSSYQQGFDFSLSHRNTIKKFSYGFTGSFTYSRNYLTHYEQTPRWSTWDVWKNGNDTYNDNGRIQGRVFENYSDGIYTDLEEYETAPLCGGTLGNYMMLPGMEKVVDLNGDGRLSGDDALPTAWSGQGTNPPMQFGASLNASYRGFDVVITMAGSSLFTKQKNRDQWGYGTQYRFFLAEFEDRWHTANDTDNPRDPATEWIPGKWEALGINTSNTSVGITTDRWRVDATYLRIKTVELGYNIPFRYVKVAGLKGVRIYLNGYNLLTFCNDFLKDQDPERDEGPYNAGNIYPIMKSFNMGLNIKF
jgi:TonB-linked SusC/RagA family outer membrane protein